MNEDVFYQIKKRVFEIEKNSSLEDYVIQSTFSSEHHRMRIEDSYASNCQHLLEVYQDLKDLELADLCDYKNLSGRFNGEFS